MLKRPGTGDTEEDLIELQNEFYTKQLKPSVVVKSVGKREKKDVVQLDYHGDTQENFAKSKSMFKQTRFNLMDNDFDAAKKLDEKDSSHLSAIVSKIQERPTLHFKPVQNVYYKTGFPVPPKLDPSISKEPSVKGKKKSLFAKHFENLQKQASINKMSDTEKVQVDRDFVEPDVFKIPENSEDAIGIDKLSIIGTRDIMELEKEKIHKENMQKLKEMDEKEILEEQKKLLDTVDPTIINFLRGKNKNVGEAKNPTQAETRSGLQITKKMQKKTQSVLQQHADDEVDPYKVFGIQKDYVNMGKVEKEKLAWMKDLPKVLTRKESATPRFDFTGNLLPYNEDIPVNTGLHHHGKDPEAPGYSLEELFQMARSNFQQQRVISLQTLARIIEKYQQQAYVGHLNADLLKQCLDAGLLFILRWSLDDQTEQIYSAAIQCFSYILYIKSEQDIAFEYLHTAGGLILPSLCQYFKKAKEDMTQEEQEEDRDLTDVELSDKDVVKGLLQMQFLPRVCYIMEICYPSEAALVNCLCILIRLVQHIPETAYCVFKFPHLIEVVLKLLSVNSGDAVKLHTIKLLLFICLSGKNMASSLVDRGVGEVISTYYAIGKDAQSNEHKETFRAICLLWSSLLNYGLCIGLVRDLYPLLMRHLQQLACSFKHTDDMLPASILLVVNSAIACQKGEEQYNWSITEGFYPLIRKLLEEIHISMFAESKISLPHTTSVIIRCCLSYYHAKNTKVSDVSPIDLLDEVEAFWGSLLQPFIDSSLFGDLLHELSVYTDFQEFQDEELYQDYPSNLPSYGVLSIPSCSPPSLRKDSSMCLIKDLVKLIAELVKINKKYIQKVVPLMTSPGLLLYFQLLVESRKLKRCLSLITTGIELSLVEDLLNLFHVVGEATSWSKFPTTVCKLYMQVASRLLPNFRLSQEKAVEDILANIAFNPKLFRNQNYLLWVTSTQEGNPEATIKKSLTSSTMDLCNIGSVYRTLLFGRKSPSAAERTERHSFCATAMDKTALPNDWMFYPIIKYCNLSINIDLTGGAIKKANEMTVTHIKRCLQFLLLLEVCYPQMLCDVSETTRLTRFLCVFVTEGSIYLEDAVQGLLQSLVVVYSSPSFLAYLKFEEEIPGVTSFYDMYCSLLEQYLSSSYGDHNFANVLLMPLQLQFDKKYRRAVWTEYCEVLRMFPLPLKQISSDIKSYMAQEMEDLEMIQIYFQKLTTGKVKPTWCPIFYTIAVHHVSQVIFNTSTQEHKDIRKLYIEDLVNSVDKEIRDDVFYYEIFDVNGTRGVKRFLQLPPSREILLRSYNT